MYNVLMLPDTYGDAILVEYGTADRPHYILIDGGPYSDYKDGGIEEQAWHSAQERLAADTASLALRVVSHVDADQIEGVIKLLNALGPARSIEQAIETALSVPFADFDQQWREWIEP
mgnify:CR=1 FL=1